MLADSDELKNCNIHGIYIDDGSGSCPMCLQSNTEDIEESDDNYQIETDDNDDEDIEEE